ncbi:conjugal transfer protein TraF [uncultured Helicobacter sp.]|uniref:conjugal transfer protein TraF n=1 Tax=uncultured Helicobacter sp. TaxID=175537 RepID=UPI00262FC7EB|nr:conjugal transfer protein TraF [uncultured Helicobacter sp.]
MRSYTTLKAITLSSMLLGISAQALEFGQMGNISAGIGGAGVALKSSQWALYYNPALLGMNKKSGFAYSFGVGYKETNLTRAASIDIDNLQSMPNKLADLFSGATTISAGTGFRAAPAANGKAIDTENLGVFGDVLDNMLNKPNGQHATDNDLKDYLTQVGKNNGITIDSSADTNKILEELKKKPEAFESVKQDLQASIDKTAQENPDKAGSLGLLEGLVDNLTPENIGGLLDSAQKGDMSLDKLLQSMGGLTLSLSNDPSLNRFVKDLTTINDIVSRNDFSLSTQNGLVMNIGSKKKRGTISIGIMPSAYMSAAVRMDPTHNQIIIQNGGQDYKVEVGSDSISLGVAGSGDFDKSSILSANAKHQISAASVGVVEVPIGYGHLFETPIGDIAVGLAAKYIFGTGYLYSKEGSFDTITQNLTPSFNSIPQTHTFGIDAGLAYAPRFAKNFTLGFVAKNLNMPKIKTDATTGAMTRLNTQLRAGLSYGWLNDKIVLAGDIDLMPNDTLSAARPKSQVAGGGVLIDLKYFDLRLGAMYDFRNNSDEGMILTGGINLLGFLDIAVQSNLHLSQAVSGISIPSYLLLKVGGGFSW